MKTNNNVCTECNVSINNGEYCTLCAPNMITKGNNMKLSTEEQVVIIESILKKQYKEEDRVEAVCPTCKKDSLVLWEGANCYACYTMLKLLDAVDDAMDSQERTHAERELERARFIRKNYGDDILCNEWKMFNNRNISTVAFEANMCGVSPDHVLSRSELEDYIKADSEYEIDLHDMEDAEVKPLHKGDLTRDIVRMIQDMPEDTANDLLGEVKEVPKEEAGFVKRAPSKEQRRLNLEFYTNRVKNARGLKQLGFFGYDTFNSIERSKITFTTEEGETITAPVLFLNKEDYSGFWAIYNNKKKELEAIKIIDKDRLLAELRSCNSSRVIREKIADIRKQSGSKAEVTERIRMCNGRIAELAAC